MSPNGDGGGGGGVPRRRLLALGAVALLAVLAGCGAPEPAPSVCYGCSDDGAGRALPPNVSTGESVTHLYLAPETGDDPRVVSRTRVGLAAADELRRNASRRAAVREQVLAVRGGDTVGPGGSTTPTPRYEGTDGRPVYPVPAFEARDLSVETEADTLVVSFRVAGIPGLEPEETPPLARQGVGGAVQIDRFDVRDGRKPHPENAGHAYQLGTDRLVVHAPPGTRPVVAPESATVRGDTVVLRSLPADTDLVFGPAGTGGTLAAHATLTADTLGWVVPDSFWVALLPTLQLGLLLGGLRAGSRSGTRYAVGALLLALLLTLGPLAIILGPFGLVAVGLVIVVAGYLLWRAGRGYDEHGDEDDGDAAAGGSDAEGEDGRLPSLASLRAGVEPWLVPVAAVAVVATVLTVAAGVLAGDSPVAPLLFLVGGVLPLVGTIGLGRLEGADGPDPRRRWLVLAVLVAPWLFAVGHVVGREVPDSLETLVVVVVWGTGATLVGFVAHQVAARFSSPTAA